MRNIFNNEFENIHKEYSDKLQKVNDSFQKMAQKFQECESFIKDVAKKQNWQLNIEQKNKERQLLNEYNNAIEEWNKANDEFKVLL